MTAVLPAVVRTVDPLPLPGDWGAPDALAALDEAAPDLPVRLGGARVVADLSTVVLRAGAYAVKVFPPGTDPAHLTRIAVALAPSDTAVLPVSAPVVTRHGLVVSYPWHAAQGQPVSWPEIGRLLRRFHVEHAGADVPTWTPLRRMDAQLAGLPGEVADVLRAAKETLLDALARLSNPLGTGVIHGDVSPANVLRTNSGPRFIDLDFVARGPLEYDLASAARRLATGEIDAVTYARFCDAYGFDVRAWDGLPLLGRLAQLGGVVFRVWDCRHHGWDLDWLPAAAAQWRSPL